MRVLLDTHVFLWWLSNDSHLSKKAKDIIRNPENIIFVSVASAWEMSIKITLKKLILSVSIEECFTKSGFDVLPIKLVHIGNLHTLPYLHKDPFDRILVAQAQKEDLTLVTNDPQIIRYDVSVLEI